MSCRECKIGESHHMRNGLCSVCYQKAKGCAIRDQAPRRAMATEGLASLFHALEETPHVGNGRHRVRDFAYAMSLEEVGEELGICWQRVQQLEKRALAKLRANPEVMEMLK